MKTGTAHGRISLEETQAQRPCEDNVVASSNEDGFDDLPPQTATKKVAVDVISVKNLMLHRDWLLDGDYCTDSAFDFACDLIQDNAAAWRNARLVLMNYSGNQACFAAGQEKFCVTVKPRSMKYVSKEKFSVELEYYMCKVLTNSVQIRDRLNYLRSVSNDSNGPHANESESSSFEAALPELFGAASDVGNHNEVLIQYDDDEFPAL